MITFNKVLLLLTQILIMVLLTQYFMLHQLRYLLNGMTMLQLKL